MEALVLARFLDVGDARFVDGDAAGVFAEEADLSSLERLGHCVVVLLKRDGPFCSDEMDDCGHPRPPSLIDSAKDPNPLFSARGAGPSPGSGDVESRVALTPECQESEAVWLAGDPEW